MKFPGQRDDLNPYKIAFSPYYVRWTGRGDYSAKQWDELSTHEIYRVANTHVRSSSSSFSLVEMSSAKELEGTFNTIYFETLPTRIACCAKFPEIGECALLSIIQIVGDKIAVKEIVSPPIKFIDGVDHFSGTCVAITEHAVFYLQIPH